MPSLREELIRLLPKVLPDDPAKALNGTDLIEKMKPLLKKGYSDNSLRQHFSVLAGDPTSPIAKVEQGHGYYLRAVARGETLTTSKKKTAEQCEELSSPDEQKRALQLEEKFRAIYIRYLSLINLFPMHIEHTRGIKRPAGVNKWKFPDVVAIQWEVGQVVDSGYQLAQDLLEVKRSLGEPPFKLISIELKTELTLTGFRESFFQCVSNSKWAHAAQLVVAGKITDNTLAEELRRLGSSYDLTVISHGLDAQDLENMPSSDIITSMGDDKFDEIARKINISQVASGKGRDTLDWEHIRDLRTQSMEFNQLFTWIAYCLEKKKAYSYKDYAQIAKVEGRYSGL